MTRAVVSIVWSLTFIFILMFANNVATKAQSIEFYYLYSFEPVMATKGPELGAIDVVFPDSARKNGVVGNVKASFTLGADGRTRDIVIVEDLPFGVGDAVRSAIARLKFSPAMNGTTPVDVNATLTYQISMAYSEADKDVAKVKITSKPAPEYPVKYRSEKLKGKVDVVVTFYPDGKLRVGSVSSTMPKEFDRAAAAAAADLKFEPAVHKKSKQPVAQTLWVTFEFKP